MEINILLAMKKRQAERINECRTLAIVKKIFGTEISATEVYENFICKKHFIDCYVLSNGKKTTKPKVKEKKKVIKEEAVVN